MAVPDSQWLRTCRDSGVTCRRNTTSDTEEPRGGYNRQVSRSVGHQRKYLHLASFKPVSQQRWYGVGMYKQRGTAHIHTLLTSAVSHSLLQLRSFLTSMEAHNELLLSGMHFTL